MAELTTNYGLTKPLNTEYYDVNVQNGNMDIIDTELKTNTDKIGILPQLTTTEKNNLVGSISEVNDSLVAHQAENASLTAKGHVQLSSAVDSTDETKAATPKAVKTVKDAIPVLNNTVTSTSTTQAATANAVKQAYDKAVSVEAKVGDGIVTGTTTDNSYFMMMGF